MKYDKIVEISKERSRQNTEVALRAREKGNGLPLPSLPREQNYQEQIFM